MCSSDLDSWSSSSSSASKSSSDSAYRKSKTLILHNKDDTYGFSRLSCTFTEGAPPSKKRHMGRQSSPPPKGSPPPSIPAVRPQASVPVRQAPARQAPEKKRTHIKMTLKEQGKVKVNRNVLDKLSDEIMGKPHFASHSD